MVQKHPKLGEHCFLPTNSGWAWKFQDFRWVCPKAFQTQHPKNWLRIGWCNHLGLSRRCWWMTNSKVLASQGPSMSTWRMAKSIRSGEEKGGVGAAKTFHLYNWCLLVPACGWDMARHVTIWADNMDLWRQVPGVLQHFESTVGRRGAGGWIGVEGSCHIKWVVAWEAGDIFRLSGYQQPKSPLPAGHVQSGFPDNHCVR